MQRALLAALVLDANRLVPRDRLVEGLWDGAPPASVNAVVSTYVSRLRKLFDGDPDVDLVSEARGYTLRLPSDRVDARRFEQLAAEGREALAAGDAEQAARALRAGLGLANGPALAEVADRPFARAEVARLGELCIAALEDRIEADLALGRHADVVGELEALVVEHPYRERLRAQLILALYRSGRQAEALAAYRDTRRTLVEDLGIEPSRELQELERKILRHDPSLDPPVIAAQRPSAADARVAASGRTRRSARRAYALAGVPALTLALAGALVYALAIRPESAPAPVALAGDSVAAIDAETGTVVGEVPLGGRPGSLAVGDGSVWVGNRDERTVVEIDPESRRAVRTIGLGFAPDALLFAAGSVWIADNYRGAVVRVDATSGTVVARARVRGGTHPCCPISLATSRGSVWAARFGVLSRIDAATNRVGSPRALGVDILSIAAGEGSLWALTPTHLLRMNARTGAVANRMPFADVGRSTDQYQIAVGGGAVWIGNKEGRALWKVDPDGDRLVGIVPLGHIPRGIAPGEDAVWVGGADGTLLRVDPEQSRVVKTVRLGVYPPMTWTPVAVAAGRAWIAVTAV